MNHFYRMAIFLIAISCSTHIWGQSDNEFGKISEKKDWGFTVTPYAFIAAQSTDVGGEKIRQSFSDLSSLTNSGFQIATTVRYKRMLASFDGTWATLGDVADQSALQIDFSIIQRILDLRAGYLVYENFELKNSRVIQGWSLEVNAGAKYWQNDVSVNYSLLWNGEPLIEGGIDEPVKWWDLMIGVKPRIVVTPKMFIAASFAVGGFGIGNSSDFTYDFAYINSFRVLDFLAIDAGFKNFRYQRVDGEGADEVDTDVNVLGPFIGVSLLL